MSKSHLSRIPHLPKRPRAEEPEECPAKRPYIDAEFTSTTSPSNGFICQRCKTIDFEQSLRYVRGRWKVLAKLNLRHGKGFDPLCAVCSFFLSMVPETSSPDGSSRVYYYLCATSTYVAFFSLNSYQRGMLNSSHPQ